jgi:hypothetical protein
MISRKGKSLPLHLGNAWKISYGTFDVKNPITFYIKLQTYITPLDDNINTDIILNSIDIYQIPEDSIFSPRFIQKTSFASTKVKKGKASCLVVTLTVKQKHEVVSFGMIQPHVETLADDFISKTTNQWGFNFSVAYSRR